MNFPGRSASKCWTTFIGPHTIVSIELGTNPATWPSLCAGADGAISTNPGLTVVKGAPIGFVTVTLRVPKSPDAKKFARLNATITP